MSLTAKATQPLFLRSFSSRKQRKERLLVFVALFSFSEQCDDGDDNYFWNCGKKATDGKNLEKLLNKKARISNGRLKVNILLLNRACSKKWEF